MFTFIKNFCRKRRINKDGSKVKTGLIPLDKIQTINIILDGEEPELEELKEEIYQWGKTKNKHIDIYFFDFRKLNKDEPLLTKIDKTIIKKDLDWLGAPSKIQIQKLTNQDSDLLLSLINNGDFAIEYLSKCTKARFKIGRCAFKGHCFDMIVSGKQNIDLRSDAREVFAATTDLLEKIQ